jgi:hypothetical protein
MAAQLAGERFQCIAGAGHEQQLIASLRKSPRC